MNQIAEINFTNIILKASVFTEVLPVIFYLYFSKANRVKNLQAIFFLLIFSFINDVYGLYMFFSNKDNAVSFNIFALVETICLYAFFYFTVRSKVAKKVLLSLVSFLIIFWVYQFVKFGQRVFFIHFSIIEDITVLFFAIYYFYQKVIKTNAPFIYLDPEFWVVTAYFVYIAGTFFLLLYMPTLIFNSVEWLKYYVLNYIFIIIRTILLSIAMVKQDNNLHKQKFKLP